MTAQRGDFDRPPAPGHRFRDQLAEALPEDDTTEEEIDRG